MHDICAEHVNSQLSQLHLQYKGQSHEFALKGFIIKTKPTPSVNK